MAGVMHTADEPLRAAPSSLPVLAVLFSALGVPTFMFGLGLGVTVPLMVAGLVLGSAGLFFAREETPSWQVRLSILALTLGGLTPLVSVLALLSR